MLGLVLALLMQKVDPAAAAAPPPDPMGQYLADLEKAGILTGDKEPATLERLKGQIAAAEDELVTGNAEIASVTLFRVVESPRYAKFDYAPEYAIAELTLSRALIRAGGYKTAERYLLRVLGRGTKSPAFAPAYRGLGEVYEQQARTRDATAAYLNYIKQAPAAPDRAIVMSRLRLLTTQLKVGQ